MEDPALMRVIDREIVRFDVLEALRHALDLSYYRVRKTARQQWERHFSDKFDPSDSCVAVHCSGFLDRCERSKPKILSGRRFGH